MGIEDEIEYLATQHPVKNSLDIIWNLVMTKESSTVIVLNDGIDAVLN